MNMLLEDILNKKKTPAIIYEDNLGCIFLIKNQQISQRTRHIDMTLQRIENESDSKNIGRRSLRYNTLLLQRLNIIHPTTMQGYIRSHFQCLLDSVQDYRAVWYQCCVQECRSSSCQWPERRRVVSSLHFLQEDTNPDHRAQALVVRSVAVDLSRAPTEVPVALWWRRRPTPCPSDPVSAYWLLFFAIEICS
jgi:hypothetical protein